MISKLRRNLKDVHAHEKRETLSGYLTYDSFDEPITFSRVLLNFTDIFKNLFDTFTPYKTARHRQRDLLQFFDGLKHLGVGLFTAVMLIVNLIFTTVNLFIFIGTLVWDAIQGHNGSSIEWRLPSAIYIASLALSEICLGISQIITSPLSLIRVTWRSFFSKDKEWEVFQDRSSIKRLVTEADELMNLNQSGSVVRMHEVLYTLTRKLESNYESKRQATYHTFTPLPRSWVDVKGLFNRRMIKIGKGSWKEATTEVELGNAVLVDGEKARINHYLLFFRSPRNDHGAVDAEEYGIYCNN